jgi:hypothetical protein
MAHYADLVEELLRLTEPAATAFVNGDPALYQELFAHNDEVTLTGPFGGEPGRGWTNLAPRMARAAALFKDGNTQLDLVHAMVEGDLACLVMVSVVPRSWTEAMKLKTGCSALLRFIGK